MAVTITAADDEKCVVTKCNTTVFHLRLNEYGENCFPTIHTVLVATNTHVTRISPEQFKNGLVMTKSTIDEWLRIQQSVVAFMLREFDELKFSAEHVNFFD